MDQFTPLSPADYILDSALSVNCELLRICRDKIDIAVSFSPEKDMVWTRLYSTSIIDSHLSN